MSRMNSLNAALGLVAGMAVGSCSSTEPIASSLSFRVQPLATTAGNPIPAFTVGFVDNDQTQLTNLDALITISLGTGGQAGATLSGTLSMQTVDGVATFTDVSIDLAGLGYTLFASAESFPAELSDAFNVDP